MYETAWNAPSNAPTSIENIPTAAPTALIQKTSMKNSMGPPLNRSLSDAAKEFGRTSFTQKSNFMRAKIE